MQMSVAFFERTRHYFTAREPRSKIDVCPNGIFCQFATLHQKYVTLFLWENELSYKDGVGQDMMVKLQSLKDENYNRGKEKN
jgi:hypothetical protein